MMHASDSAHARRLNQLTSTGKPVTMCWILISLACHTKFAEFAQCVSLANFTRRTWLRLNLVFCRRDVMLHGSLPLQRALDLV